MNGQTMREQLEGAYSEEPEEELEEEAEEEPEVDEIGAVEEEPGVPDSTGEEEEGADAVPDEVVDEEPPPPEEPERTESDIKAPASWTPKAREHWNTLPGEIQEEVAKREAEISQGLQQASGHRKIAEEYKGLIQPYESLIASQNSTPGQTISNLMNTAARLLMGTPAQKAEVVAEIVNNYGVDVYQLDTVLSGQELPNSQSLEVANLLDQRLAPINDFMNKLQGDQRTTQETQQQEVTAQVEEFAKGAEFYEDVRNDMADMLDLAAQRNQPLDLQTAYDRACAFNPQISEIVAKRKAAEQNTLDSKALAKKRAAASSVTGNKSGDSSSSGGDGSIMSTLRNAWDDTEE